MIKSIFVPLAGVDRDKTALEAALDVARLFDARLDCLHVRPDPRQVAASLLSATSAGGSVYSEELWKFLIEADKRHADHAKATFEKFVREKSLQASPHTPYSLSATFREIEGDPVNAVVGNARFADLAVFAPVPMNDVCWGRIGDTIVSAGRPVLLAPTALQNMSAPVVTIAWKETAESARAVTAAMPLLAKAGRVHVLAASERSDSLQATRDSAAALATLLRGHGINAEAECVECGSRDPEVALLERAVALKSSLLAMGAYGHNRVREFMFGGFTRFMLQQTKLPVLLQH